MTYSNGTARSVLIQPIGNNRSFVRKPRKQGFGFNLGRIAANGFGESVPYALGDSILPG